MERTLTDGIYIHHQDQKHFLKLRIFPTQKIRNELFPQLGKPTSLTDYFYDSENFTYGENNEYIRERGGKYVLQKCEMIGNILSYSEKTISDLPLDCVNQPYLCYSFQRYHGMSFNKVTSYLDVIKLNEKDYYEVVTLSKEIPHFSALEIGNLILSLFTEDLYFFDKLKGVLQGIIKISEAQLEKLYEGISGSSEYLPLPTKFMTMLQLSVNAHLYLDIFSQHDAFIYSQTDHLKQLVHDGDAKVATKYFWTSSNRMALFVAHFNAVYERSGNAEEAQRKASSCVEKLYDRNNHGDFSFEIFGELMY